MTKLSRIAFVFSFLFGTIAFGTPKFNRPPVETAPVVVKPAPTPVSQSAQDTSCVGQPNGTRCALSCGVGNSLVLGKCKNGECIIPKPKPPVDDKPVMQKPDAAPRPPKPVKATNVCNEKCIKDLEEQLKKLKEDLLTTCPVELLIPDPGKPLSIQDATEIRVNPRCAIIKEALERVQKSLDALGETFRTKEEIDQLKKQVEKLLADLKELGTKLDGLPGRVTVLEERVTNMVSSITELANRITALERRLQVDVGIEVGPTFTGGTSWVESRLLLTLRYRVHDRVDLYLRGGLGLWTRSEDRTALSVAGAAGVAVWFDQYRKFGLLLGGIFSSRLIPGLQTMSEAQYNPGLRSWMAGGMAEFRFYPTKMLYLFVDVKGGYTSTFLASPARLYRGGEGDLGAGFGLTF